MWFWSKKAGHGSSPSGVSSENPYRILDPATFDKGAKINRQADELRRNAAKKLTGSDLLIALQTALGNEVAETVLQSKQIFSADQKQYVLDQVLDAICPGVREAAYIAADLPKPSRHEEGRNLTDDEFNALTTRILNEATKNNTPVGDALTATAKALGLMISILHERPGVSSENL
jgi:hypothetical protein